MLVYHFKLLFIFRIHFPIIQSIINNIIIVPIIPITILTPLSPNISYINIINLEPTGSKRQFHLKIAAKRNKSPTNIPNK